MSDRLTEMNNALEKRRDSLIKIDTPSFDERQETLEERRDRLTELPASQKHNESFLNQKNQEFDNYVKGMLESDNSEKVGNTLALVDFFSRNYDTDKTTVLNHLDSYINDYYGENTPRKTALTAIGDEFKRSRLNNKIAFLRNGSLNTDDELYKKWAAEDIAELKKADMPAYNKFVKLIKELHEHPRTGTGKPELLKYGKYKGIWSRRITDKHRLVYSINDNEIVVLFLSAKGHYDDK